MDRLRSKTDRTCKMGDEVLSDDGSLRASLLSFVTRYTGHDLSSIRDQTDLADCGLDSLTLFNFLLDLEREFEFVIPESEFTFARLRSFGGVFEMLKRNLRQG